MPKEYLGTGSDDFITVRWGRGSVVRLSSDQPDLASGDATQRFVQLDRESINRLIRTLRRARDQAYGADE